MVYFEERQFLLRKRHLSIQTPHIECSDTSYKQLVVLDLTNC